MNVVSLFNPPRLSGRYLKDVLSSRWLTTGPVAAELKKRLGKFLSVPPNRISLASSATAGCQAILDLLSYRGAKTVQVTEATWPGIHQAIRHARLRESKDQSDILILTSIGGSALIDPQERHETSPEIWIHDACHSWEVEWWADWSFMSLYPTKLVPGAEGGVVVAPSEFDARELDLFTYCGLEPGAAGQGRSPSVIGRKTNMTDVQAALAMEALELAPAYIAAIGRSWDKYAELASAGQFSYRGQPLRKYLFQIEAPLEHVPKIRERLEYWGVPTAWNFWPSGLITLPMYPDMSPTVQGLVLSQVDRVLTELGLRGPTQGPR